MIGVFPFSDIDRIYNQTDDVLNRTKKEIENRVGWHQYINESRVGDTATSQGLLLLNHIDGQIDQRCIDTLLNNFKELNSDSGGWNFLSNSNHITTSATAWVVLGLLSANCEDQKIKRAINWLETSQNADGGWGIERNTYSRYYETYLALKAIKSVKGILTSDLKHKAINWIINSQKNNGGWGRNDNSSSLETAFALLSLLEVDSLNPSIIKKGKEYLFSNWHKKTMWEHTFNEEDIEVEDSEDGTSLRRIKMKYYVTPWVLKALLLHDETIESPKIEKSLKWLIQQTINGDFKNDTLRNNGYFWALYDSVSTLFLFKESYKNQKFDKIITFHKIQFSLNKSDYLSALYALILIWVPAILLGIFIKDSFPEIPNLLKVIQKVDNSFLLIFIFVTLVLGIILVKLNKLKKETYISLIVIPIIFGIVGL